MSRLIGSIKTSVEERRRHYDQVIFKRVTKDQGLADTVASEAKTSMGIKRNRRNVLLLFSVQGR